MLVMGESEHDVSKNPVVGILSRHFLAAKVELRRGLGGSNGLVFDALVDGKIRLSDSVFLSGGPRLSVTDATFNQAYFGINATQSAASGMPSTIPARGCAVSASAPARCGD
jgi:outer membrane scaffolding protein for murein synthesis (MipA/OmpV family)